ncbi:hypothetical protein DCS_06446 [Drechmeria coniospora]|uniref:Uncharacterized protein n=1 Tax=Drechmeria coniospora TaxID=98403 RepID=A0A151GBK8_DRECN|nr:hypothetical protein DCS_06446 [Drechmeria coniospora]KYK54488.1 hypothetical protein DCS_06446 [Drechmeria coniospora]
MMRDSTHRPARGTSASDCASPIYSVTRLEGDDKATGRQGFASAMMREATSDEAIMGFRCGLGVRAAARCTMATGQHQSMRPAESTHDSAE